jgi:integrase
LLDKWLEVAVPRTVRPENIVNYRGTVDLHLKPALGSVPVRKLRVEQVESLFASMQADGYSSSTIKNVHLRLSAALKMAKRWNIIAESVCDIAKPPKLAYKPSRIWTPAEVVAFLAEADDDALSTYWRLMIETGARTSELLGVTWADVDLEHKTVRFGEQVVRLLKGVPFVKEGGKSESACRTVRITDDMAQQLKDERTAWLAKQLAAEEWGNTHDLVFCSPRGRPLNARNVRRSFDRLIVQAGVTPVPPHSLRKLHITAAIAAGANVKAVAARVGHRDLHTTLKTYQQLTGGMDDALMDIVEAFVPRRAARDAG